MNILQPMMCCEGNKWGAITENNKIKGSFFKSSQINVKLNPKGIISPGSTIANILQP